MLKHVSALSKQFFGVRYESSIKSLLIAAIIYTAASSAELQIPIAPFILYLTSVFFTAGIMWQLLTGKRQIEAMQGMLILPFDNRSFVFPYVFVLGMHTLIVRTLPIWALFYSAASWNAQEIFLSVFCGIMACMAAAAWYLMFRKGQIAVPVLWGAGLLAIILLVRQWTAVLTASIVSLAAAVLYLTFADAYDFYSADATKKTVRHTSQTGSVFIYFLRYLMTNKSYLINSAGLCAIACFLPKLLGEFHGLNLFPVGLALLLLNTPICTLLSSDPDLEQAVRILPGQADKFLIKYGLFIFSVSAITAAVYLCSWQMTEGGIGPEHVGMLFLFAMQSGILSAMLEWKYPLRSWKTESDLWHHPRKYIVPIGMLLMAAIVSVYPFVLWIWSAVILAECCALLYAAGRE